MAEQQTDKDALNDVGARLRAVRQSYGLSQRKLAAKSGVSNASISLIEKNKLNPSIGMLIKILSAFPLTLPEFWQVDVASIEQNFFSFKDLRRINNNKVTYYQVGDATYNSPLVFQYEVYEPGMNGKEVQTKTDAEMVGFILEGRLEVIVGNKRRILGPGEAYRFNARIPHQVRVVGTEQVKSISCTVPPVF